MFQSMQAVELTVWYVFQASVIGCICFWFFAQINKGSAAHVWVQRILKYCFEALVGSICMMLIFRIF